MPRIVSLFWVSYPQPHSTLTGGSRSLDRLAIALAGNKELDAVYAADPQSKWL
jgi:hypothetical protein